MIVGEMNDGQQEMTIVEGIEVIFVHSLINLLLSITNITTGHHWFFCFVFYCNASTALFCCYFAFAYRTKYFSTVLVPPASK